MPPGADRREAEFATTKAGPITNSTARVNALDPAPEAKRLAGEIELNQGSYLILGLVNLGYRSGYAIRKAAELSTQGIWPTSLARIYPELGRLHEAGLLARHTDPRGAQKRSAYTITPAGTEALRAWLLGEQEPAPMRLRNEGFLRLFFADHLSLPGQLQLIRASAAKERAKAAQMRGSLALRPPADPSGTRFPALTARYGIGAFEFSSRWLARLAERIEAGGAGSSAPKAPEPPALPVRPSVPIKLTTTSYLILGLVSFGSSSGYAIRKGAEVSTQACWPTSFAQLYPQLGALARAGLLDKRNDPDGGRLRSAYSITPLGETALRAWLASPRLAAVQMRNEGLLRLFFADLLSPAEQLTVLEGFRARMSRRSVGTRDQLVPLAELGRQDQGIRYPAIMAHLGVDVFANSSRLMGRLQRQLEAG